MKTLKVQLGADPLPQEEQLLADMRKGMIERQYKWKEAHINRALDYFQVNIEDIPERVYATFCAETMTEHLYIDTVQVLTFLGGAANYLAIHHYRK